MKHLIIGTAGHIDHGKTSLIKMLTGIDCDTHKQEKERGITINLGFSHIDLPSGESAGIIDVPGHKDFINTMVGGASGIDLVLLVIAADSGIMPQTIEHINIITSLGITKGVVALTKCDLVDEELIEMASQEISEYLENTSLKGIPIVGVSAQTGDGKDELIRIIDETVNMHTESDRGKLFRMYIDRIFTVKGMGTVVTGSVMSGSISIDEEVWLLPRDNKSLRIRSMERHGKPTQTVVRGDRAAINLTGLRLENFKRGMIISNKNIESTTMIDATISLFSSTPELKIWSNVSIIAATFTAQARMHLLDKDKINGGEEALVQIHMKEPAILMTGDRFIIRNSSDDLSLGGGLIIDQSPLHHRKRTPKLLQSLQKLSEAVQNQTSLSDLINQVLVKDFKPFFINEVAESLNIDIKEITTETEKENPSFCIYKYEKDNILISENFEQAFKDKIIKIITNYHSDNPLLGRGMEPGEIAGKMALSKIKSGKIYIEKLLEKMQVENLLDKSGKTWIINGYKPTIDDKTMSNINWLENEIRNFKDGRPIIAEIDEKAQSSGIKPKEIKSYMAMLASQGKIKYINNDFIHTDILNEYRTKLVSGLANSDQGVDYNEFKEIVSATKALRAILLDYFEKEKIIRLIHGKDVATRIILTEEAKKIK